jgi:hypothetical protein
VELPPAEAATAKGKATATASTSESASTSATDSISKSPQSGVLRAFYFADSDSNQLPKTNSRFTPSGIFFIAGFALLAVGSTVVAISMHSLRPNRKTGELQSHEPVQVEDEGNGRYALMMSMHTKAVGLNDLAVSTDLEVL